MQPGAILFIGYQVGLQVQPPAVERRVDGIDECFSVLDAHHRRGPTQPHAEDIRLFEVDAELTVQAREQVLAASLRQRAGKAPGSG